MIVAVTGKPRGGKSYNALKLVVDELINGKRVVVTNLAIRRGVLSEYLQREFPLFDVDLDERLRILGDDELRDFFLHREKGREVSIGDDGLPQIEQGGAAVLYVLDEIHLVFSARGWAETWRERGGVSLGKACLWYLSQHGKLGDDVVWITQYVSLVDKQFRAVTQEYWLCRNFAYERFGRIFRSFRRILVECFLSPPSGVDRPMWSKWVKVDPKLACCYDTSKGVGIGGGGVADIGRKEKGVPVWVLLVLAFCLPVFLGFAAVWLPVKGRKNVLVGGGAGGGVVTGVGTTVGEVKSLPPPPRVVFPPPPPPAAAGSIENWFLESQRKFTPPQWWQERFKEAGGLKKGVVE